MTIEDVKKVNKYSQPRIAAFLSEGRRQYFIVTECRVLCEIPTLQDALFYAFAAYYIFNLTYPKETEKILFFFKITLLSILTLLGGPALTSLRLLTLRTTFETIYTDS